jgi:hypothetical protein
MLASTIGLLLWFVWPRLESTPDRALIQARLLPVLGAPLHPESRQAIQQTTISNREAKTEAPQREEVPFSPEDEQAGRLDPIIDRTFVWAANQREMGEQQQHLFGEMPDAFQEPTNWVATTAVTSASGEITVDLTLHFGNSAGFNPNVFPIPEDDAGIWLDLKVATSLKRTEFFEHWALGGLRNSGGRHYAVLFNPQLEQDFRISALAVEIPDQAGSDTMLEILFAGKHDWVCANSFLAWMPAPQRE